MNFIKKHPYLFFELIGILGLIVPFAIYFMTDIPIEIVGTIMIIAFLDVIIAPIIIAIIRTMKKSNNKYDIKSNEYINSDKATSDDEMALKKIRTNSNILISIGIILAIPLLIFTSMFLITKELGAFFAILMFTILLAGTPIMIGISYKKHPEKHIDQFKAKYVNLSKYVEEGKFTADKSKWHWDAACEVYCRKYNKNPDTLTDDDIMLIWEYARNHIAYFLTWLIENDFYQVEEEWEKENLKAVKERKRTGSDVLAVYDEVLSRFEISNKVIDFVDSYYDKKYMEDYSNFVENTLGKEIYGISFSWDDYEKFKKIIDMEYMNFKGIK